MSLTADTDDTDDLGFTGILFAKYVLRNITVNSLILIWEDKFSQNYTYRWNDVYYC